MRSTSAILPTNPGFTLVESLLVLAMLLLGAMVLLPAAGAAFRRAGPGDSEEQMAVILQQIRREAVVRGQEVVMRFDAREQRFTWEGAPGAGLTWEGPELEIGILRRIPGSAILLGGQKVETSLLPVMRFFPDGTCDPVRLQLRMVGGVTRTLTIDPWTCAPGLEVTP